MSERGKHLFQFPAAKIAEAARGEAAYHLERANFWLAEMERATDRVRETAGVKVEKQPVTGGWRPTVTVDYGDPQAYQRMSFAASKLQDHEKAAERFQSDALLYGTQGDRTYDLDGDDVHHFRLNGRAREE